VPIVLKSGSLNLLETSGPVEACTGIALALHFHNTARELSKDALRQKRVSPAKKTANTNIVEHQLNLAVLPSNEIFPPFWSYRPVVPPYVFE